LIRGLVGKCARSASVMISLLSHLHDRVRESALKSSGRSGWIGISSRAHAKDQRSEDNEGVLHWSASPIRK
jgi:hypothetical protein